ncbi:hypothetical protein SNEBB_002679 [Seison nebaliae]|nr:hypothetical protein SNEBB_002679 [Seison nebaliae]
MKRFSYENTIDIPNEMKMYEMLNSDYNTPIYPGIVQQDDNKENKHLISLPKGVTNSIEHVQQNVEGRMKNDKIIALERKIEELQQTIEDKDEIIKKLYNSEKKLKERLINNIQSEIERSTKFEDISLAPNLRCNSVVQSFKSLYEQQRIDAIDALDELSQFNDLNEFKLKLLFTIFILSFRFAEERKKKIYSEIATILNFEKLDISCENSTINIVDSLRKYLKATTQSFDLKSLTFRVMQSIQTALPQYRMLNECKELHSYIKHCIRISWSLINQHPPLCIEYSTKIFDQTEHVRFHTSDLEANDIVDFQWPTLIDTSDGECVVKGIVTTKVTKEKQNKQIEHLMKLADYSFKLNKVKDDKNEEMDNEKWEKLFPPNSSMKLADNRRSDADRTSLPMTKKNVQINETPKTENRSHTIVLNDYVQFKSAMNISDRVPMTSSTYQHIDKTHTSMNSISDKEAKNRLAFSNKKAFFHEKQQQQESPQPINRSYLKLKVTNDIRPSKYNGKDEQRTNKKMKPNKQSTINPRSQVANESSALKFLDDLQLPSMNKNKK